jgi:hypothetical protein
LLYIGRGFGLVSLAITTLISAGFWCLKKKISFEPLLQPAPNLIFIPLGLLSLGLLTSSFVSSLLTQSANFTQVDLFYNLAVRAIAIGYWIVQTKINFDSEVKSSLNGFLTFSALLVLLTLPFSLIFLPLFGLFLVISLLLKVLGKTASHQNRLLTDSAYFLILLIECALFFWSAQWVVDNVITLGQMVSLSIVNIQLIETIVSIIAIAGNVSLLQPRRLPRHAS